MNRSMVTVGRPLIIFCMLLIGGELFSQCLPVTITPSSTTPCRNEKFSFNYTPTVPGETFAWNFCEGDLITTPDTELSGVIGGLSESFDLAAVTEGELSLAFVASRANGKIALLRYNGDYESFQSVTDVISITRPQGITPFEDNGVKYAIVALENGNVRLLTFGTSWLNTPTQSPITSGLPDARHPAVQKINGKIYIFIPWSISGAGQLTILQFDDIAGGITQQTSLAIGGSAFPMDVQVINECGSWYAVVSGYLSGLHLLSFGNNLFAAPAQSNIAGVGNPLSLNLEIIQGNPYLFVSTGNGSASDKVVRLDFGPSINNTSPVVNDVASLPSSLPVGFDIIAVGSRHIGVSIGMTNSISGLMDFPKSCDNYEAFHQMEDVDIAYPVSGVYTVGLTTHYPDGSFSYTSEDITVQVLASPVVTFDVENVCEDNDVNFTSTHHSAVVATYDWDFGDGTTHATSADATHQFLNDGQYTVTLNVTATNGCPNYIAKTAKIYPVPAPSFTMPSGVICTNNEFTFVNTIPDIYDDLATFQWFVDDEPITSDRDLLLVFSETGAKSIKLNAAIPGCASELTQMTSDVQAGPPVDFVSQGNCANNVVAFSSTANENILSYQWDFDDGGLSGGQNADHTFTQPGDYEVTLSAVSVNGCNNEKTKTLTIFSQPQPDFTVDGPPNSCSGVITQFNNLTPVPNESDITNYQWTFGDPGGNISSLEDPTLIYPNAGDYIVSLTVVTDKGCSNTIGKTVTISPSLVLSVLNTSTCVGVPAAFTTGAADIKSYYWQIGTAYYTTADVNHTFTTPGTRTISLTVTGTNNCETTVEKLIHVPARLTPDFSVTKNCTGVDALFTDLTTGVDPIEERHWNFHGLGTSDQASPSFVFNTSGQKNVVLDVITEAGCTYSVTKAITVIDPPVASFTADPETGATPLEVQFTNHSTGATSYLWTFETATGEQTSTNTSPAFTFEDLGEFDVKLIAANGIGCQHEISKTIAVVSPLPDIELKLISISENPDGTYKVIVTIHNNGNTVVRNLPVDINISNNFSLRETIAGPLRPDVMYNLVLDYGIHPQDNLEFICASTVLTGDLVPEGNRICKDFENTINIVPAYPNPARDALSIEWIAVGGESVSVTLADSYGRKIRHQQVLSEQGLNQLKWNTSTINDGIYILAIDAVGENGLRARKIQRILVSNQN